MGIDADFYGAFFKAQAAAGNALPLPSAARAAGLRLGEGRRQAAVVDLARRLVALGFEVLATSGTHAYLAERGHPGHAGAEGGGGAPLDRRPDQGRRGPLRGQHHRRQARDRGQLLHPARDADEAVPYFTTMTGARAAVGAMEAMRAGPAASARCRSTTARRAS